MKINLFVKVGFLLLLISIFTMSTYAEGDKKSNDNSLKKTTGTPNSTRFNINKIGTYIYNDGKADIYGSSPGYFYPVLGGKTANFQSGFLWGGYVGPVSDNKLKVGGSVYRTSLTPGRILPDGKAASTNDDDVRIYRVRRDYKTGSLSQEVQDENKSAEQIYNQYDKDWKAWPGDQGAPFEYGKDANGVQRTSGSYNPNYDIPGVPGADQTIWFVANDLSSTAATSFYGTTPMGMEIQCTVWGYRQAGALGQMLFKKYVMINKSQDDFNQFYVAYWSDTDIGGGSYDLIGCDTTKSLFYTYSGVPNNTQYATTPPATGFDFFQGPIVRGTAQDSAIFKGKRIYGWKNLPMSAHTYFINGDATLGDPDQNSAIGTIQWYNLFTGKGSISGAVFKDPSGNPSKLVYSGDPVTGTGWLDTNPADRRNEGIAGPFTLAKGDTQEVVIAQMTAGATPGVDNIGAVRELFQIDEIAQVAYDRLFQLPTAAPMQAVKISAFDKKLILNWSWDAVQTAQTESFSYELTTPGLTTYYDFQGYNVYQLPTKSSSISEAIKLKTYDIIDTVKAITDLSSSNEAGLLLPVVVANGTNSGLTRILEITQDAFTKAPLINGTEYYFAVTSYSYNPTPQFGLKVLENPLIIITAVPHANDPGVIYVQTGDAVSVTRVSGTSDGNTVVTVADPSKVTGAPYKIKFADNADGVLAWSVLRRDTTILANQTDYAGNPVYIDGMLVGVSGPAYAGVSFTSAGTRWLTGLAANGGDLMFGGAFLGGNFWGETAVAPADLRSVHVEAFKALSYTDTDGNGAYTDGEPYVVDPAKGQLANMYSALSAGKFLYTHLIPFKFYAIEPDGSRRQLSVIVRDRDKNGQWDANTDAIPYNYIFVLNTTYDPTGNDWNPTAGGKDFMAELNADGGPVLWAFWWYPRGGTTRFSGDFTMDFIAPKLFTAADAFSFTAPIVGYDKELAKSDIDNINVFPNPYYGVNPREINKYSKFVTFSHLPEKATIRIFNLAGQLIRTIIHDDPQNQFQKWDLLTDNSFTVASGLYIVHIDMPDLGKSKILKVAIIQEQQILDHF